jgi:hypothetical protein
MVQFCYIVTLISTCFGAATLIFGFSTAQSAPQEAAIAAAAIALAVIPYVFSRCVQISADRKAQQKMLEEILAALKMQPARAEPPLAVSAPVVPRTDWQ